MRSYEIDFRPAGEYGPAKMTVHYFLADQPFGPERLKSMSAAYESACAALGLVLRDDPATRIVAERIVEHAQRGVSDPGVLLAITLREFKISA